MNKLETFGSVIYYYECSDDGEKWWLGDCSFNVFKCLDMARQQPYPYRIKTEITNGESKTLDQETIEELARQLYIFDKL